MSNGSGRGPGPAPDPGVVHPDSSGDLHPDPSGAVHPDPSGDLHPDRLGRRASGSLGRPCIQIPRATCIRMLADAGSRGPRPIDNAAVSSDRGAPPAYRIETQRLLLRCWSPADAPALKEAIDSSLSHLRPWLPWAQAHPLPLNLLIAELRQMRRLFDADEDYCLGAWEREGGQLVGGCGLHRRAGPGVLCLGYWLRADRVGHGFATEVAAALTRVGFETGASDRLEIRCQPDNRRSAGVAEKLGYRHEATLRRGLRGRSASTAPRDAMIWSLLVEDYPRSPAAQRARADGVTAFDAALRPLVLRLPESPPARGT